MNRTLPTLAALLLAPLAALHTAEKPDILLIMPDQMRGDCLSALGHPVVRTPQLDELARQGTLFRRAYSTVPSCIPARYALLTGLAPQTSGVVGFFGRPMKTPALPAVLSEAGYAAVLVGRNMHQTPACGTCGYQQQILGSTYVSGDEYDSFLKRAAPDSGGIRQVIKSLGVDCNMWPANPWALADNLHPTAWVVGQSRRIVTETPAAKPLFLTASFYAPHPPLFPPKKYFDAYLKADLPKPAHGGWVDWSALSPKGADGGHRVLLEGEALRRAQAGYFGLIEQIDSEIAPLIAAFKARSEKAGRPWVIVVTSDHGEMLGDHGYFRKCEPYEGSANIPFIVTGAPALGFKSGQRNLRPVCMEDIMPTLLELAGAKRPDLMTASVWCPCCAARTARCESGCTSNTRGATARPKRSRRSPMANINISGVPTTAPSSCSTWTRTHARNTICRNRQRWNRGANASFNDWPAGPKVFPMANVSFPYRPRRKERNSRENTKPL
jgi:arylsulfatase